jgi:spore coat protein A
MKRKELDEEFKTELSDSGRMSMNRRTFMKIAGTTAGFIAFGGMSGKLIDVASAATRPVTNLRKYAQTLPIPGVYTPGTNPLYPGADYYEISMAQFSQKLHPDLPLTPLWGYGVTNPPIGTPLGTYPSKTIVATKGTKVVVKWKNELSTTHPVANAIDSTIPDPLVHGTLPTGRAVAHLHGGFTLPQFDGHPHQWFMPTNPITPRGSHYVSDIFEFSNNQDGTALWFHDHAFGITRLNVYAGLAGYYLLRDASENALINGTTPGQKIPGGAYEVPLVIQDKMFNADGTLLYPVMGLPPGAAHQIWIPEFFGDTIVVNGAVWPFLNVEPRRYRFRILNGSNARFYNLWFDAGAGPIPFHQIGTDGGMGFVVPAGVVNSSAAPVTRLLLAPGERADVIVDFAPFASKPGKPPKVLNLRNNAKAPFPGGRGGEIPEIMQFRVGSTVTGGTDGTTPAASLLLPAITPLAPSFDPVTGLPTGVTFTARELFLIENPDPVTGTPREALINDKFFDVPAEEKPTEGGIEVWQFINTTGDAHPMHIHLVQFQILNRQPFDSARYYADYIASTTPLGQQGTGTKPTPLTNYLMGVPVPPAPNEKGMKDTAIAMPGEVLRVIARFNLPAGTIALPTAPLNPTITPGSKAQYVTHCHILEHEENEMMRPFEIV